jgi:integral membrane protein
VSPSLLFRTVAFAEAVTWTILITVMVLKYAFHIEGWFTFAGGLAHGFVFIAFAASAIVVGYNQRWPIARVIGTAAAAVVPYLTIPLERSLERRALLDGAWRTEATDHPRDASALDRLFRWFIARPALFLAIVALAVVGVVGVLLVLGPPGEWGN